jgi:nucleoside-diphosphate-sugar epimerase
VTTRVLILGGAGFIGSNLAQFFATRGNDVTILDGLLPRTGADRGHLRGLPAGTAIIDSPIENVKNLAAILDDHGIIIDCMAWTRHRMALRDPLFDCACNLGSHLHLLTQIREGCPAKLIYLGSRGQYGNPRTATITESSPMDPQDVQGIHKAAADHHFRAFAKLKRLNVLSLRFVNCHGPNQPREGEDIGLVGGFIRDALDGRAIVVYGDDRRRSVLYVEDLCQVVERIARTDFTGFSAFNLAGHDVSIRELAERVVETAELGKVQCEETPDEIKAIDMGQAIFSDASLSALIGPIPRTDLRVALGRTIDYFKGRNDLAV